MQDNKISVIIPTFNCQFIDQAIESVIAQSYNKYEIIVVDDGSTDDTKDTVCRFSDLYPDKINYYYQHQQGPAAARNTGIKKSCNEYVAFLDADDIWLKDKIEKQMLKFKQNTDIRFVYCDNYFIDKNGRNIKNYVRKVKLVEGDILLDFFMDFFLITSGIILKRSCIEKIGLFNTRLEVGEDFEFFLRLAQHFTAGVVKEKLFKRRVWEGSLSKQDYEKNQKIDISTLKKFFAVNRDFYSKHRKFIKKRMAEMYFRFGYRYRMNGRCNMAFHQFIKSLNYRFNYKALKNILICYIPNFLQELIKEKFNAKS